MKNLFPNIETAIIFLFVVCVMLYGVSRCSKKREAIASEAAATGSNLALDTTSSSPAAVRSRPSTPSPADPSVASNPIPNSYSAQPTPAAPVTSPSTPSGNLSSPSLTPKVPAVGSPNESQVPKTQAKTPVQPSAQAEGTSLFVLINGLNLRAQPNLRAKSLGKLKLHDRVTFMEEVTDIPETVRLADGTEITKPWYKIKTKRGTIGWAHGSGLDFYRRKPQGGI
ncbi:MAG: SH3 domain-containing protein [Saprospiraceae bacterium]|nr:SH3 domain-containing protein [Saprospiraceae bacterium]